MKKLFLHNPGMIILSITLFLLTESSWLIYWFRIEEKNFRNDINQAIHAAIREEAYRINEEDDSFVDFRIENRIIMEYTLRGQHFRIDTLRKEMTDLFNKQRYDYNKKLWKLDSIAHYFRHFCPVTELPVIFTREDPNGKLIDHYPSHLLPQGVPAFGPQELGNIEKDQLMAWYDFPLIYFWKYQKYGILLSLLPLFLAIYYGFLIIKKECRERKNLRYIEKQVIFIHDLKTPLCTNRDIEGRILKNLATWPPEKIYEKLQISRHQSERLLKEMQQITIQSAGRWGGEIENRTFDLKKALEELIDNYRCGHEKATINLDFQLKDPEIFADPFHLIHLVDNLISNALKYAGEKAEIQITCKQEKPNKLLISVKDNEPGVSTHSRKRIFRTGFHSNHRHQNSHGIGLAYVRKIVRQYNGHIQIKSKENEGSEFCLSLCLDKPKSYKKSVSFSHIYRYFFIALLLAEMVWMFNLYSAERTNFVNHESPLIDETIFKMSKNLFQIRDTARFQNNWQENSITITRGVKDTTVEMGGIVNQSYVYGRLSYDLRDSSWCLDSLVHYYKKSDLPFPIFFIRKDANGKIIDRYPSEDPHIFLPVVFRMPLGYVEGHRLEVQLAYPWLQPLTTHKIWLLFALLSILLSGWFTHLLMAVDRRQKALIHLQRNEVQHFLRELQVQLCHLYGTESDHPSPVIPISPPIHVELLHKNIKQYENMIIKINYLLDKLTILKTHPMILYHDYGY